MSGMSLTKMVGKDFELPEEISEAQLREVLVRAFEYLVEDDFPKLVQILYRADVDQDDDDVSIREKRSGNKLP